MATSLVAFQGERGSFSEEAAYKLLGRGIRVLPCETFAAIFESVTSGRANYCLVPIENTLAGSVYENFDLLLANNLHIVSEVSLRIVHNLIALPGTKRKDVRQVYSHPVALAQCGRFFAKNPQVERITFYDTAGSVKMLAERRPPGAAAIASRIAAEVYHARILATHLEDHRENYTRFFLLSKTARVSPQGQQSLHRVFHAQPAGRPLQVPERFRPARHRFDQNGIAALARPPLGILLLSRFCREREGGALQEGPGALERSHQLPARAGVLRKREAVNRVLCQYSLTAPSFASRSMRMIHSQLT